MQRLRKTMADEGMSEQGVLELPIRCERVVNRTYPRDSRKACKTLAYFFVQVVGNNLQSRAYDTRWIILASPPRLLSNVGSIRGRRIWQAPQEPPIRSQWIL